MTTLRDVSRDLTLASTHQLEDGTSIRAIDVQWSLYEDAVSYAESHGLESVGQEVGEQILIEWLDVLEGLESDPESLADRIDWIAKRRLIDAYRERHDLKWGDARLAALDLQYHDLRPDRGLAPRIGLRTFCSEDEIIRGVDTPPTDTRAYFRGTCLRRFSDEIIAANWDSLVFDIGEESLRRVPMMEPLRGTVDLVGSIIESSESASVLLDRLGATPTT